MPRSAKFSTTPLAQVRRYFGLDQATLATYLGVGVGMVGHIEAGRKVSSSQLLLRLRPLLQALPTSSVPAAPAAHLAPPAAAPLAARRDYCQHHAARLRRELAALTQTLDYAHRWQAALPALLAVAPDERARAWLLRRQEQAAADLGADTAARYHLLRLRAEALEAEAAGLTELPENDKKTS
jgi:transcriptional regulator with XRE-family HTH domain